MPTYEYECSKCGHAWELFQSIKAEAERKCPKCAKMTAVRKIGMGAAIFTGARAAEPAGETAAKSAAATVETTAASTGAETKVSKTDAAKPGSTGTDAAKSEPAKAGAFAGSTDAAKPAAEARRRQKPQHPPTAARSMQRIRPVKVAAREMFAMPSSANATIWASREESRQIGSKVRWQFNTAWSALDRASNLAACHSDSSSALKTIWPMTTIAPSTSTRRGSRCVSALTTPRRLQVLLNG